MKLLCITPILHIPGLYEKMSELFQLEYMPDPRLEDVIKYRDSEIIFTNPNKSKVYLDNQVFSHMPGLKFVATASTGTIHINKKHCDNRNIKVISITKEFETLNKISSTAEHAFLLTLAGIRNLPQALTSVAAGEWNYEKFVGRQLNQLTVGVVGFGRLGKMYSQYARAFTSSILIHDPEKRDDVKELGFPHVTLEEMFKECDAISLHIHAEDRNLKLINENLLAKAKKSLLLINTSRGEIVCEQSLIKFLTENSSAKYYADVFSSEQSGLHSNDLFNSKLFGTQVVLSPHIGGMTLDAQALAYGRCFDMLREKLKI